MSGVLFGLAVLATGCGGDSMATSAGGGATGAGGSAGGEDDEVTCLRPGATVDEIHCRDGQVYAEEFCQPTTVFGDCEDGCYAEGIVLSDSSFVPARDAQEVLCRETPNKRAGDPCLDDADCLPSRAVVQPDGSVVNVYLRCDVDAQQCIAADPTPPSPLAGLPCAEEYDGPGCVKADFDEEFACTPSAFGRECVFDRDCPSGSICEWSRSRWGGTCKRGAPGEYTSLRCCICNWDAARCDSRATESAEPCPCDDQCFDGKAACAADGRCDQRCFVDGTCLDPDCELPGCASRNVFPRFPAGEGECSCDQGIGTCESDCRCDPDCAAP